MSTKGSRNLNRIFRVTANLLFEKGEKLENIYSLMQGFVDPRVIRNWHEKWKLVNGVPAERIIGGERLPLPPIDWSAVTVEELEKINDLGNA